MSDGAREALRVFSREGCHLCEILIEELLPMTRGRIPVEVLDIDTDQQWQAAYNTRIPVVEYKSRCVCQYQLDVAAINAILIELGDS